MKINIRPLVIVAVLVNLPACSYIKNLFPDKEKDYQCTTEIAPLVLPSDLAGDSIAKVPSAPVAEAAEMSEDEAIEAGRPTRSPETDPATDRKLIRAELADADQGAKRLHITAPSEIAWRMVGKALSRKAIEVTNRNQDERLFTVQYDPNRQEAEDGSFLDELVFILKGFDVNEQEYVIKLLESDRQTDVIITDKEQKPASDGAALSLLTLLYDTIKADLAK